MNSSADCQRAWENGYKDGWSKYPPNTIPPIPPMPGGVPTGITDELAYYHEQGRIQGELDKIKHNAGLIP